MIAINQTYVGSEGEAAFNDDTVVMSMAAGTHVDALAHVTYDGLMYNGFPDSPVTASAGATQVRGRQTLDPDHQPGRAARPARRRRGVERLDAGYAITEADLDAAVEHGQGAPSQPGDVLLVRTGQMQHLHAGKTQKLQPRHARACRRRPSSGSAVTTSAPCSPTPTSSRCGRPRTGRR